MIKTWQRRSWSLRVSLLAAPSVLGFTVMLMVGVIVSRAAQAQTLTVLHNFRGGSTDGAYPDGQPVVGTKGNIFGTTTGGGGDPACAYQGCGTVWKLSASGKYRVLHVFTVSDGARPSAGLKLDQKGNMFGTTAIGGAHWGTAFSIDSSGSFSTLYDFGGPRGDPEDISSAVTLDPSDNLYGVSYEGGIFNAGTVWELSSSGTETVLHNFNGGNDGGYPEEADLHRDKAGKLYGVAEYDGAYACGTLFEISASGTFGVLHAFNCATDGGYPTGSLREYKSSLYGTASDYGVNGRGTVWRYDLKSGKFYVLHSFSGPDGAGPNGGVACQARNNVCAGNLFGTTVAGGNNGCGNGDCGTVFEITADGGFTLLHKFGGSDGANPYFRPFVDGNGNIYGTAYFGGSSGFGTLWKITP